MTQNTPDGDLAKTFRKLEYTEKQKTQEPPRPAGLCPMAKEKAFPGAEGYLCRAGVYCGPSEGMMDWRGCPMFTKYGGGVS